MQRMPPCRPHSFVLALLALLAAQPLRAQQGSSAPPAPPDRLSELERKLDILTGEIERLKLGGAEEPLASIGQFGLAPAASKIYQARTSHVAIGGYGELTYRNASSRRQNADPSGLRHQADLLRAVLYVGYRFSDRLLFNSELEFEHAGSGEGSEVRGEVSVEQAYLDFRLWDPLGLRAGLVLVPLGLVNPSHEPTTFHGVRRPGVENDVIPSTWRENGVGLYGRAGLFAYQSYLVTGLSARSTLNPATDGFTGARGIRGGRTEGSNSFAEDLAWASRIDVKTPGVLAGGSFYVGEADQGQVASNVPVSVWDLHAALEFRGAMVRALYAEGAVGNADAVDAAQGFTDAARNTVGSRLFGGYVEAAFDLLSLCPKADGQALSPFFRYERYDTQLGTPGAFSKDPANSRVDYTAGVTYKPVTQVAVKADYQWRRNQARTGINQWNLGLGWIF